MKQEKTSLDEMTLVGMMIRTNNNDEMNPETGKIAALAGTYHANQLANGILHRATPGITYCVYTDFESDENGEYSFFIGETVASLDDQDLSQFKSIVIPQSQYTKFTTAAGQMPGVVISAWQNIWAMDPNDFGGKRRYIADFEVYDQRAMDPNNTVIDIYIGIEQ